MKNGQLKPGCSVQTGAEKENVAWQMTVGKNAKNKAVFLCSISVWHILYNTYFYDNIK